MRTYIILFFIAITQLHAQKNVQIDTSYTVYSSYLKYKKEFPTIKIVKATTFKNVYEKRNITYKTIGKRKLQLDAFCNSSKNLKPAIILVHGGGWKSGNKSHVEPLAQHIAANGYACFTVEYRLSLEALYPAGIEDVKSAVQFVKKHAKKFKIDTTKVAILGCSSGGQMASLIGVSANKSTQSNTSVISVQAVVNLDGILAFKHPESQEGSMASLWLGGTYNENPKNWTEASALTHVHQKSPPILFINSQYPRFHAGRDDMINVLNNFKIYNQVVTFNKSPHTFWLFNPYFSETVQHIVTFLDKVLK